MQLRYDELEGTLTMTAMPKNVSDLPAGTEFFNVNGVPVAVHDFDCVRFDTSPPSVFSIDTLHSDGVEVSRSEFMRLLH